MCCKLFITIYLFSLIMKSYGGEYCETTDNFEGECVKINECPFLFEKVLSALHQMKPISRLLNTYDCQIKAKLQRNIEESKDITYYKSIKFCCPINEISNKIQSDQNDFVDELPKPPVCGVSSLVSNRIVGGSRAKYGDFPWMALLGYTNEPISTFVFFLCGGSLITNKHVLTAAHCTFNDNPVLKLVRFNEMNLLKSTGIDYGVKKVKRHDGFSLSYFVDDIAIILLKDMVQFTETIRPICLPTFESIHSTFEGITSIASGYGELSYNGNQPARLQYITVPIIPLNVCNESYAGFSKEAKIDERVVCAGFLLGQKDTCKGDSGGPLVSKMKQNQQRFYYYQIGIVSLGFKCAEPGFPGVYTKVSAFLPWLYENVLGRKMLDK